MDSWYNGQTADPRDNFLDDASTRLIGSVTLRQLRVKKGVLTFPVAEKQRPSLFSVGWCHEKLSFGNHSRKCIDDYSQSNEDRQSYETGWITTNVNATETVKKHSFDALESAFRYHSANELDTYPYLGQFATYSRGGYVYELRTSQSKTHRNITELRLSNWTDDRTRAVIIQMNLYNANIHMFTSVLLLMEFLSTGSLHPSVNIQPLDLESTSRSSIGRFSRNSSSSFVFRFFVVGPSDRFDSLRVLYHLSDGDRDPLHLHDGQTISSPVLVVDSVGHHRLVVGGHVDLCVASRRS